MLKYIQKMFSVFDPGLVLSCHTSNVFDVVVDPRGARPCVFPFVDLFGVTSR